MKLTGNLKKQVEKAESRDEKKSLIEKAGMLLTEDELEMVSGGKKRSPKFYGTMEYDNDNNGSGGDD
ncbi:MAG: hypothetical protein K6G83_14330 [Lachnospiraceae bacterium]|nr:hypothetical protein [Lachnospiraceae bacterium]